MLTVSLINYAIEVKFSATNLSHQTWWIKIHNPLQYPFKLVDTDIKEIIVTCRQISLEKLFECIITTLQANSQGFCNDRCSITAFTISRLWIFLFLISTKNEFKYFQTRSSSLMQLFLLFLLQFNKFHKFIKWDINE